MDDREYQLANLGKIYSQACIPPVFKPNPSHPCDGVPMIAVGDLLADRYVIRCGKYSGGFMVDDNAAIVASYENAEALVSDGWRLD